MSLGLEILKPVTLACHDWATVYTQVDLTMLETFDPPTTPLKKGGEEMEYE